LARRIADRVRITPRIRIVRFSKPSLEFGQEIHDVEGVPTRIFPIAKTVADCFKCRNKIGLDVALEALRECMRNRKATMGRQVVSSGKCDEALYGGSRVNSGCPRNIEASIGQKLLNVPTRNREDFSVVPTRYALLTIGTRSPWPNCLSPSVQGRAFPLMLTISTRTC